MHSPMQDDALAPNPDTLKTGIPLLSDPRTTSDNDHEAAHTALPFPSGSSRWDGSHF
jgi:hypothetical protein